MSRINRYSGIQLSVPFESRTTTYFRVRSRTRASVVFPLPVCPTNSARSFLCGINCCISVRIIGALCKLESSDDTLHSIEQLEKLGVGAARKSPNRHRQNQRAHL